VPVIDPTDALARACVGAWVASRVKGADRPGAGEGAPAGLDRAPVPR
jgi:hypothetical protein